MHSQVEPLASPRELLRRFRLVFRSDPMESFYQDNCLFSMNAVFHAKHVLGAETKLKLESGVLVVLLAPRIAWLGRQPVIEGFECANKPVAESVSRGPGGPIAELGRLRWWDDHSKRFTHQEASFIASS